MKGLKDVSISAPFGARPNMLKSSGKATNAIPTTPSAASAQLRGWITRAEAPSGRPLPHQQCSAVVRTATAVLRKKSTHATAVYTLIPM